MGAALALAGMRHATLGNAHGAQCSFRGIGGPPTAASGCLGVVAARSPGEPGRRVAWWGRRQSLPGLILGVDPERPQRLQPRVERLRRVIVATLVKRLAARRAEPLAVVATDRGDRQIGRAHV